MLGVYCKYIFAITCFKNENNPDIFAIKKKSAETMIRGHGRSHAVIVIGSY